MNRNGDIAAARGVDGITVAARHFVAVSTPAQGVADVGIAPARLFGVWDRVVGCYRMDPAIGRSTLIAQRLFVAMSSPA